jgi:uncharacterized protein YjaG (DUF416 family)
MNFIKKIFMGKTDKSVHLQFQKFSKGEFRNKAIIEVKKGGKSWTIKTSAEFSNELVRLIAEKAGETPVKISGAIISTLNLKENIEFNKLLENSKVKQFQGVKKYLVNEEIIGNELLNLIDNNPKIFFALSFDTDDSKLKIKIKAPKSGKPSSNGDEKPKANFCSLKTSDENIVKDFIFEKIDFKEAKINHNFFIEKIEIPAELKNSKDFVKIREESKRIGKIVREAIIDGQEIKKEIELEA